MQRNVTSCDACGADDLEPGYTVVSIQGERSKARTKSSTGRPSLDLCDACDASLAAWIVGRKAKPVEKADDKPIESATTSTAPPPETTPAQTSAQTSTSAPSSPTVAPAAKS